MPRKKAVAEDDVVVEDEAVEAEPVFVEAIPGDASSKVEAVTVEDPNA
jgi:hypothetical protein